MATFIGRLRARSASPDGVNARVVVATLGAALTRKIGMKNVPEGETQSIHKASIGARKGRKSLSAHDSRQLRTVKSSDLSYTSFGDIAGKGRRRK